MNISKESRAELEALIKKASEIQQPLWDIIGDIRCILQNELLPKPTAAGITVDTQWESDWANSDFLDAAVEAAHSGLYCDADVDEDARFTFARVVDNLFTELEKAKQSRKQFAEAVERDAALRAEIKARGVEK
jgi:hypothetical protein